MGILIEKVRIKNFRSLKNVEVSLAPLTLLVGANNAGKTSFLRALNLALGVERRIVTLDDLFIDRNGRRLTNQIGQPDRTIAIDVKIVPVDAGLQRVETFDMEWSQEFGNNVEFENGTQEYLAFRVQYVFSVRREEAQRKSFIIRGDWNNPNVNENTDLLTASLEKIPLYFIDAQRDILDDLRNRTSYFGRLSTQIEYDPTVLEQLETQLRELNEDAIANSSVMSHLKEKLEELNATIRAGGSGVEITPLPKKIRDLHKTMKVHFQDGESDVFELDYHGMGTRSWASLLAFKAYVSWEGDARNPEPKQPFFPVLALEEPEAHLHPNAQRQLYGQLKSINGQKIISTHSPSIVGQASLRELRFFRKSTDATEVEEIDTSGFSTEDLRKVQRTILHSKGELFFAKMVILSEGETEEQALPMLAEKYFGSEPFCNGINFIGSGGSNYGTFIKIFKKINIPWLVFSDYDTPETQSYVNNAMTSNGLTPTDVRILKLNVCLEEYLINTGYQVELRQACITFINGYFSRDQMKADMLAKINRDDVGLLEFLKQYKTKLAPFYAETIGQIADPGRQFPPNIRLLFEQITQVINPPMP